jgi:hypothetical protein
MVLSEDYQSLRHDVLCFGDGRYYFLFKVTLHEFSQTGLQPIDAR